MLLGNNEVSVAAGDFSSTLGEANNLSTVSFTTNVGLGVDYKISKKKPYLVPFQSLSVVESSTSPV